MLDFHNGRTLKFPSRFWNTMCWRHCVRQHR